ncbi:MAG: class I SAM-dependent methyltransferase [Phycisphaerales bacterium]
MTAIDTAGTDRTAAQPAGFEARCAGAACRSCRKQGLTPVLDLGQMPLADGLRTEADLATPQARFPLELAFCPGCSLVQILETLPPKMLFGDDYPYFSSFSDALLEHSRKNAENLIQTRGLGPSSLVVELASNDGYLLRNFVKAGIPVLGIDPAPGPAEAAKKIGVNTVCDFFTLDLAQKLATEGKRADVVIGNNVLAHVADTNGFVAGIAKLLKPTGVAVIEAPYVRDLIDHGEFDTIYHEHLCYFSVTSAGALFRRHGLFLNRVERLPIHGGSLRYFVEPVERPEASVKDLWAEEAGAGLTGAAYYARFADTARSIASSLRDMLSKLRAEGKSIAAYGAAAKGAIMLNFARADERVIDFVVDRNTHKHGKHMPGSRIPIRPVTDLLACQPDYTLMLAWNFKDEIMAQQAEYRARGGKFIVPIPSPHVV